MWTMLLKYLPKPEAAAQARALEEGGTEYGTHFDLNKLLQALDTYIKHYNSWDEDMLTDHWCKVVGGAQRMLPAHVVNEYCRPDRSFHPTPTFKETSLPRTRAIYVNKPDEEWFSVVYGDGRIGDSFAVWRGMLDVCFALPESAKSWAAVDHPVLQSLWTVRTQQLASLKSELYLARSNSKCNILL